MREIKFRGKSGVTGEWLYGDLIRTVNGDFAIIPPFNGGGCRAVEYEVKEETIGQFAGLHDMYGEDIYEGDILRLKKEDCLVVVGFNDAKGLFGIRFSFEYRIGEKPLGWWLTNHDFELVGNRFDNPELLKGGYV